MTALKASDVEAFVSRPDPERPVVVIFGPDAGLVRERGDAIIRASVDDPHDPFALVRHRRRRTRRRSRAPGRGGEHHAAVRRPPRRVGARPARSNVVPALEALLATPADHCRVVIEAGDLKRNAALRALAERSPRVAAIACYPDDERTLTRLIDERAAIRRPDDRAGRARRARCRCSAATAAPRAARCASSRFTPRTRSASSSMTCRRWWPMRPRSRSTRWSTRRSPAAPARSRPSSPRRGSPARRPAPSFTRRHAMSGCCIARGSPWMRGPRSIRRRKWCAAAISAASRRSRRR